MHSLEHHLDKVTVHTAERALRTSLVQDLVVTGGLQHGHVMLFLVMTDLTTHTHSLGQQFHQVVVELIDLFTQLTDSLGGSLLIADDQQTEDEVEHVRCHLLLGITPCLVRLAMTLHDQSVEAKVHGLLAQRCNQFAASADMTRVADDGQFRDAAAQLDGNLPHRHVTVDLLVVGREAAVDGTQSFNTCLVDTLQRTDPQL